MMLLIPRKQKYVKSYSNRKVIKKNSKFRNLLKFSKLAIVAKEAGYIPNYQIEAIRLFLRRFMKKRAQMFFRIFPNQPITKKPNEIRLGRGKGNLKYWAHYVKKNKIILELCGQNLKLINFMVSRIKYKFGIKTFLYNQNFRWIF